jgi:hypothetical protein
LEILNQKSVSPENFGFSRTQLEEVLDVELSYKVGELGEWGVKGLLAIYSNSKLYSGVMGDLGI